MSIWRVKFHNKAVAVESKTVNGNLNFNNDFVGIDQIKKMTHAEVKNLKGMDLIKYKQILSDPRYRVVATKDYVIISRKSFFTD